MYENCNYRLVTTFYPRLNEMLVEDVTITTVCWKVKTGDMYNLWEGNKVVQCMSK